MLLLLLLPLLLLLLLLLSFSLYYPGLLSVAANTNAARQPPLPTGQPPASALSPFPCAPCPFHSCASRCALIYPLTKRSTVAPPLAAPRTPLPNSFAYHLRASCEIVAATRCSSDCFSSFTPCPALLPFSHPFAFPLAVKCITMNYVGAPSGHPAVTRK